MLQISKRLKRVFAFLVGFMMIVGQSSYLSPSTVYGETENSVSTETVYMLTDKLEAGQNYIVASGNSGSVSILERDSKEITSAKAEVISDENGTYIKAPLDGAVWTAKKGDGSGTQLVNGGYAVGLDENGVLTLSKDATEGLWSYDGGSQYLAATGGDSPAYMVFAKGFEASNGGDEVNLFVESEIETGQDEDVDSERGPPEEEDSAALEDEDTPTDNDSEAINDNEVIEEAPVAKAAPAAKATVEPIGEPTNGTVLAFTSDIHNASNNTAANRLDTWLVNVASIYGGINAMSFCGDMGSASAGESQFWDYAQAVMNVVSDRGIPGVYTTGNHEFYNGNYLSTSNAVKKNYVVGNVGKEGSNYIIYCMGTTNWSGNSDNFTTEQITALTNYLDSVDSSKPIIVLVHFPLHRYSSRSTANADKVIDALNAAADDGKKIVFLWGHNHTMSDTNYDQIFAPGDSITYNSNGNSKKIKFYYGAAGCMSDSEYGSGSAYVKGKGLVIKINNKNQLSFTYYDANANNVTEGGTLTEQDPVAAQGIAVSPTAVDVEAGRTTKLAVSFTPEDTTNKSVTWTSSNTKVATVDTKGKVKGLTEGTTTITATSEDGGFTATCEVTVVPRTSVESNYVIKAGDYVLSTEVSTDQATTSSSSWSSSSYVYKGLVAVADSPAAGTDEETRWIFEESEDGSGYYIKTLDGRYLNATYTSSGSSWSSSSQGNLKLDDTSDLWVAEGNYLKSTNASNGNSSAKYLAEETGQAGTHLFTVRSKDNADEVTIDEAGDPVSVESISLDKETATVEAGKSVQLTATVLPENATNKNVIWTSSEKTVATVTAKGKVKGVAEGTTIITATAEDNGKTATCEVTVTPGENNEPTYIITIDGYALTSNRSDNTATGGSSSYTYTGLAGVAYTDGEADDSIRWIMEETTGGYYIKSPDGLYLNATYTSGSNSGKGELKLDDTQDVWVVEGDMLKSTNASGTATSDKYLGYEESPANLFTVRSSSNADAVTITEADESATPATDTVDFVPADTLEAGKEYLIANGNTGKVYVVSTEAGGSRTLKGISATVEDNKITITENAAKKAAFTCELGNSSNENTTLLKNGTQYLYTDSSNGLRMITLTSSEDGKYWHYKADGKNLLWFFKGSDKDGYTDTSSTYKYYLECSDGNFTDAHVSTTSLSNTDTPAIYLFEKTEGEPQPTVDVTGVTLDKTSLTIEAGQTAALTATVKPSNATNKKVTWASSDPDIATVDAEGKVTGVAAGETTVTVTTVDGEKTATCDVTVTASTTPRYILTDTLTEGGEYLIVNDATVGSSSSRALKNPGGTTSGVSISSSNGKTTVEVNDGNYIETEDTDIVWTAAANEGGFYLTNDGDNLEVYQQKLMVFSTPKQSARYWTYAGEQLKHNGGSNTYAVYYTNGSFSASSSTSNKVYLFQKVTEQVDVTGVSLDKDTLKMEAGETETLTATVKPANATNKAVTWTSSDPEVATVKNGVVEAVAEGTAVITVKTTEGDFTDTCNVTVTAPATVDYVPADSLEAGKEYLIANGNTGKVYVVSTEAGGSRTLKGISATVEDNKITITENAAKKAAFTCELGNSSNENTTLLKNGTQYLYTDSSNGLRMITLTSSEDGKYWHYKADGKNLLWFFKGSDKDGYTDTSSTYKYYLECSDGNFTDAHVSTTSLSNTDTPAIYLFAKSDGTPQHEHAYGEPTWAWADDYSTATATFTCTDNDDTQTVVDSEPAETVVTEATCTKDKVVKYVATVSFNEKEYSDATEEITVENTALGHKWGEWEITTPATCTEKGEKSRTCELCDAVDTAEVAANGHTAVTDEAVPATCTEKGKTEGSHCSVCNAVIVAQEEIPALDHKWGEWEVTTPATCTANGEKSRTCGRCDAVDTKEIAAAGHTIVTDEEVPATCTEKGKTEGKHCSVCNAVIVAQEEIPALDHEWGEWVVNKPATCTEDGQKCRMCDRCDLIETETLPMAEHTLVKDKAVAATCTKPGKTEGSHCAECGEVIVAQKEVPALGHKWKHIVNKAGLHKDGSEYDQCTVCKTVKNKKVLPGYTNNYVKSLKVSKAKKAFTVKWAKQSKANQKQFNGYQIRYSTNANMNGAKYATAGKSSKSKKFGKLAKKTRYYVQVRTYTTTGGKTYYSNWSGVKAVTTK